MTFNRYSYANNNPYKYIDPDGRVVVASIIFFGSALLVGAAMSNPDASKDVAGAVSDAVDTIKTNIQIAGAVLELPSDLLNGAMSSESPDVPSDLVGEQDGKGGSTKGRHNSGPLSAENGGTGNAESDFDKLTGGNSGSPSEGSTLPEGSRVGENGIVLRPGENGPRIDIPENGTKPRETLHYDN